MSRFRRRLHDDTEAALANFALTFAKALLVLCFVIFVMISPDTKKDDGIKPKMEYMIIMDWPGDLDYDVDIWIRDPEGRIVFYGNREAGFLNLERDDLGKWNDTVIVDGQPTVVSVNQEIVAVRGIQPGEYVINVHLFRANRVSYEGDVPPFKVDIRIEKLNPTVRTVYRGSVTLRRIRDEVHVTRFTMTPSGEVLNTFSDLPIYLRERISKPEEGVVK